VPGEWYRENGRRWYCHRTIDCSGTEVRTIDDLLAYVDPQWSKGGMCLEIGLEETE